jgi:hypothetical protein
MVAAGTFEFHGKNNLNQTVDIIDGEFDIALP